MLDTGIARPPSPTYTAITPVTRAPEKNEPAARTELPARETVGPSTDSSESQRSAQNNRDGKSLFESVHPTAGPSQCRRSGEQQRHLSGHEHRYR